MRSLILSKGIPLSPEQLEPRMMLSTVQIFAAGVENTEQMQLQIDGSVVQTFNDIGGDANAGQFQTYTFNTPDDVTADQVRIAFTNDFYDNANDIDSNLRVDAIVIDGTRYETEGPGVFSTGTWKAADGIVPGFRQNEFLHADGYFQFAGSGTNNGSRIQINAAGYEGDETMQLLIDGNVVQTWTNIGEGGATRQFRSFDYTAAETVSVDRIRVQFTNDAYVQGVQDRNIRVDDIIVDGVQYETESPDVFSTGTWKSGDGIVPGYRESETLHANGYFQFGTQGNTSPGVISLENSVINVGEGDGVARVTVVRTGGSDGQITVDYRTIADTADAGGDYASQSGTLTFADGETSQTVDIPLVNDDNGEPTESFSFTIDNVLGGATLLAPRTATITIADNDFQLPNYPNFNLAAGLALNGSATTTGGQLLLTPASASEAGSAYYNTALPINDNTSFQTNFAFQINGGNGAGGADGFAFVIQNSAEGTSALGGGGGLLGYSGVGNSLAIEFDTYANAGDPNDNHVAVLVDGQTTSALQTRNVPFDLNSGSVINAWVDYNGLRDELAVYVSTSSTKPDAPLLVRNVNLAATVGDQAYLGFSAGTGGLTNVHRILNWSMNLEVPPIVDPPGPGDELQSTTIVSGLNQPNAIQWTPDGQNLYIAEKSGLVKVVRGGTTLTTPFIDFRSQVNDVRDRGLMDIAIHPDFENNPYIYLLYTYDPPEVNGNSGAAGPDGNGNRAGRLTRVTADAATNYTTAVAGSEITLLGTNSTWNNFNGAANSTFDFDEPAAGIRADGTNIRDFIASDSESHTVGGLDFGPDGALYVSIGDGTSYNQVDPRTVRVQDIDNLSGKVLRIDALTGEGLSDNPFFNGDSDANRSKVYYYGLRNPFRIAVNQDTGDVYVGDVGWTAWEEVNVGPAGSNFGWPFYEGGSGTSNRTGGYRNLAEANAFYNSGVEVTPSAFALNHAASGINAIILGDSYNGSTFPPEYNGDVFFNDLGQGILRNLSFNDDGTVASSQTFATGTQYYVQMRQGPDGNLYWVDLVDGLVGRWEFV